MAIIEWLSTCEARGVGIMLRKCASCGSYLLSDQHCGLPTRTPHPPKFSSADKYGKYRRMAKSKA